MVNLTCMTKFPTQAEIYCIFFVSVSQEASNCCLFSNEKTNVKS